ncbi:MAG TPA: oxygenase MpaB family protein [Acidimicrobiales bacterium]|nr:oxygenase MpaB family protein [Acidimicrobiales bacterium]
MATSTPSDGGAQSNSSDAVSIELRGIVMNALALAPAGANVVMQLSRLPVGRGVAESRVSSGALTRRPIKRTRTTLGYILVALLGDDDERATLRREVNGQHREVRSRPDDAVSYDAFDTELQLWVAACMYRGALDAVRFIYGTPSDELLDELYAQCSRFATTLQVTPDQWPPTRAAFDEYWESAAAQVEMDDVTRAYLRGVVALTFLPRPLRVGIGPLHEFVTAGFLPEPFRSELGLAWDDRCERRFVALMRATVAVHRRMPRVVREFPLNAVWWDTRRRFRSGQSFV